MNTQSMIEEIQCNDEQSSEIIAGVKINVNRFRMLCNNVENCLSEIDNSIFELVELKDKLLLQYLPPNVLLKITLVLSRFYRAYSQSQIPIYELIRLVQLYSQPFDMKCVVLKRLYDSNEINKRMLNVALQRLTSMEYYTKQYQEQKTINNWEKMYIRLALPRSHVRKWKFRIKTFRKQAELGYEHVIDWISTGVPTTSLTSEILSNEGAINDQDIHRFEALSDEIINEQNTQIDHEINRLSIMTKIDIEIQAQPDFDDQQTSTEDVLSTKSLIMRIYRPIGILKTKFQCVVHAQGQKYPTNAFFFNKSNAQSTSNRTKKPFDPKTKKRSETSTSSDDIDINTIDKQQTDELVIQMPNVFKRRSLFQTNIDSDAIKIDVFGDEKLCGSLILASEDLQILGLPNLYSPISSPLIAIDDNESMISIKHHQIDFDQSSNEIYNSWISRTPQIFTIYNNKQQSIGKLPLLMFWYNKIENTRATKSTMTIPMEDRVPTPEIISIEKNEIVIPSIDVKINGKNTESICSDDHIEIIKTTYENAIAKLHENYQSEIHQLTNLLNEILSHQIVEIVESDENTPEIIQKDLTDTKNRQQRKHKVITNHQTPVYGKDLPKNFLDRYQMYLQRSIIHRHQLITKIEQETALANERQMEIQHRLYRSEQNNENHNDLCLPAVFMPFQSGNIFNPRAYQYFHPVGSNYRRLTQPPSILKLPSLPSKTVSVLNLFELSRTYEKDCVIDKTSKQTTQSTIHPTSEASN